MIATSPKYRPDIDGLRAIAVGAVLLFHAGIPGFSGGYVGVDVFFVISGFLITTILWRECEAGKFSLVDFYERRVRRIMPALLMTLALTLAGGVVFLGIDDLSNLAKTVLATLAFISNIKFWRGSGYFEGASEMQPLLHTWSLAIEEQFYLFWPILLFLIHRYARKSLGPAIWVATLGSLALSAVMVFLSPSATFYLLPTRAWELSIGALVALGLFPKLKRMPAGATEWLGIALVIAPVLYYDPTTLFPGLAAIPPCLGTALLIQAGTDGTSPGPIARLLSMRPVVAVGLISYSLYLIHFPVLVYLRHWHLGDLPLLSGVAGIAISILLAYLSYRLVEQPFRNRAIVPPRRLWIAALAGNVVVGAAALAVWVADGLPGRFTPERRAYATGQADVDEASRRCIAGSFVAINDTSDCTIGKDGPADAFVWGDSHAAALSPALRGAFDEKGYSGRLLAFNACPPLLGYEPAALSWADRRKCAERNRDFVAIMRDQKPSLIVIHGFWSTYSRLLGDKVDAAMEHSIAKNLDALAGHKVFIVLDTPRSSYSLPWSLAYGRTSPTIDSSTNDAVSQALRRAAAGRATILDPSGIICPDQPCAPLSKGRPILSDGNHLAASVAENRLTPFFVRALPPRP